LLRTETGLSIRQTDSLSTVLTEKPEIWTSLLDII
jgi:hypothetical protein